MMSEWEYSVHSLHLNAATLRRLFSNLVILFNDDNVFTREKSDLQYFSFDLFQVFCESDSQTTIKTVMACVDRLYS